MTRKKSKADCLEKNKVCPKAGENDTATSGVSQAVPISVVGLGASAGGLEALRSFLSNIPEDTGMAYVVVAHLAPDKPSLLPELLQRATSLPVCSAGDGQVLEAGHIYVGPPGKDVLLADGSIQLLNIENPGAHLPINSFFMSLAHSCKDSAVAVILSGTGSDGTMGIKEIKKHDGLVLAQDAGSASHGGMPQQAVASGMVDIIAPPEEMAARIQHFFKYHPDTTKAASLPGEEGKAWLDRVFALLRARLGHDFSVYKVNTLLRRINRRMVMHQIDVPERYVDLLRSNSNEVEALFHEILIGVTSFFRDPESFEVLKKHIQTRCMNGLGEDATLRIWVPGCSTGEEAYSLAILVHECLEGISSRVNVQIFGTDIDSLSIEKAREGVFPKSIVSEISTDRLHRFFVNDGESYRIRRNIRDCIVFSVQDVIKDPPFSRLDLLCCRNLLIYLDSEAQKRLLPLFHYTLKPDGILVLGPSESIGGFSNLFKPLNAKWKIFAKQLAPTEMIHQVAFPLGLKDEKRYPHPESQPIVPGKTNIGQLTQKMVLEQYSPPAVLVDANANILHVSGRTGKYLEATSGPPSSNLLDLARDGLRIELSSAIRSAINERKIIVRKNVQIRTDMGILSTELHVLPLHMPIELEGMLLIVFMEVGIVESESELDSIDSIADDGDSENRIFDLERELQHNRETHQSTIEELESSNEELRSTNEELQSSNEELQSSNEELESSKEELQSLNEEMQTVNSELQSKLEELSAAHDDMRNLLNSTEIATIFVDNEMRIKRFTKEATSIVNLIASDIGRPLRHVMTNLTSDEIIPALETVLQELTPLKREVRTTSGAWYTMRVMPYRTMDNRIDGGVITFANISDQKVTQEKIQEIQNESYDAWLLLRAVFDNTSDPLVVLDAEGKMVIANNAFKNLMAIKDKDPIKGKSVSALKMLAKVKGQLEKKLSQALKEEKDFLMSPFNVDVANGGRLLSIHGSPLQPIRRGPYRVLLRFVEEHEQDSL